MSKSNIPKINTVKYQLLPLVLTVITALILIYLLFIEILALNSIVPENIYLKISLSDVLIGFTVYVKTSVDFALVIGNLMGNYRGMKNRIAIEIGTALGNALGTMSVLVIWDFFKEIKPLLTLMIIVAALVLLKLAEESLEHVKSTKASSLKQISTHIANFLSPINRFFNKGLHFIIPHLSIQPKKNLTFWGLVGLSLTIPFILGLDDFAGYVPLFNIVNVFGFAIGAILGHMLLNLFLFLSPHTTRKVVKNQVIAILGALVFIGLALLGFFDVYKLLFLHH